MTIDLLKEVLLWCTLINFGLLLWWLLMIVLAHDWVYRYHSRWFKLSVEQFDVVHYSGMAILKMATFFFNLVPYLALVIVT